MSGKRWSRKWDCCQQCGGTTYRHRGKGLCKVCYNRKDYADHREEYLRRGNNWYLVNREHALQLKHNYYRTHREERLQYNKRWHITNRDKHNEQTRDWIHRNRERFKSTHGEYARSPRGRLFKRFYDLKRRALKMRAEGSHTFEEWEALCRVFGYIVLPLGTLYVPCLCCNRVLPFEELTEDHIIPLSRGGSDNIGNIQPLCIFCNQTKFTSTIDFRTKIA